MPVISFFFGNWAHKIVVSRLGRYKGRSAVNVFDVLGRTEIQANNRLIRSGGLGDVNG